ncbi:Tetracycline repressor protein class E [Corynebacterium confusum]|nr:Tetracycline repressor protein class E [Corynebacterium confusum]
MWQHSYSFVIETCERGASGPRSAGPLDWGTVQLSRETIIKAALDLLDTYGLADTTMRRVAGSLGVAPGALYWHISNKQGLISALSDAILAPLSGTSPAELSLSLRANLLAHRDGAEVVSAALSQPHSLAWEQLVARFKAALGAAGHGADDATRQLGAESLVHLVLGSTTLEQSLLQFQAATGNEDAEDGADLQAGAAELARAVDIVLAGIDSLDR